jgi:hypothetical protein
MHGGSSGHGQTWLAIAYAVEAVVCSILDLEIQLQHVAQMVEEIYEPGDISSVDLSSLGLDYQEIELGVRMYQNGGCGSDFEDAGSEDSDSGNLDDCLCGIYLNLDFCSDTDSGSSWLPDRLCYRP